MNKRIETTEHIAKRLSEITPENGYLTDVGRNVYIGNVVLQEIETPCVVLIPEDESPKFPTSPFGATNITYEVFAFAQWSLPTIPYSPNGGNEGEYLVIDNMLDDLKKAIGNCQDHQTVEIIQYLSGDAIYSADGGNNIGAQITIEAMTSEPAEDWT